MDYLELSIKKLEDECYEWSERLKTEYKPDLVIYVAKAGYLIGNMMSKVFAVPLLGIKAERKGNIFKTILQPILKLIPSKIRYLLIKAELKSNIHKSNSERKISFINNLDFLDNEKISKIVIVDDSVDTGNSIIQVKNIVKEYFPDSEIKIAALNVWDKSEELVKVDFALYKNTIIKAPMSKDSKEYNKFISIYKENFSDI